MLNNETVAKLVQYITENNLKAGAKLPSIRELAVLWDSNPSQIRTALIALSSLGMVDMHSRAGTFVKQLSPSDLDRLFVLFFQLGMLAKPSDTVNFYVVKTMLDREIFLNATKYRNDQDLFDLTDNLNRQVKLFHDIPAFIEADEQFHHRLAQILRNPLVEFLMDAIQGMLRPYRTANFTPEICKTSYESHIKVLEAIQSQNAELAQQVAVEHSHQRILRLMTK